MLLNNVLNKNNRNNFIIGASIFVICVFSQLISKIYIYIPYNAMLVCAFLLGLFINDFFVLLFFLAMQFIWITAIPFIDFSILLLPLFSIILFSLKKIFLFKINFYLIFIFLFLCDLLLWIFSSGFKYILSSAFLLDALYSIALSTAIIYVLIWRKKIYF